MTTITVQEDKDTITFNAETAHDLAIIVEALNDIGAIFSERYGSINRIRVPRDQGDDVVALDKELQIEHVVSQYRIAEEEA